MLVYLLRHGIAEEASASVSDPERSLTAEGKRRLKRSLSWLAAGQTRVDLILSSPFKRAMQTAEIARACFKVEAEILQSRSLQPSASPEEVWDEIRVHRHSEYLMLVGHNPLFSDLTAYLLGTPSLMIDFKKGAVLCLEFESLSQKPRGVLRWYITSRLADTNG